MDVVLEETAGTQFSPDNSLIGTSLRQMLMVGHFNSHKLARLGQFFICKCRE